MPTSRAKRIFIFDDDENYAAECVDALELRGFDAHAGVIGNPFLAQIDAFKPDVILLDLHMPDFDGLEALQSLRNYPNKDMRVIFVSAAHGRLLEAVEKLAEAHAVPVAGILPKPLIMRDLIGLISAAAASATH